MKVLGPYLKLGHQTDFLALSANSQPTECRQLVGFNNGYFLGEEEGDLLLSKYHGSISIGCKTRRGEQGVRKSYGKCWMKRVWLSETWMGASRVAQWLRIRLPMQGTRVRALVWEDPTCRRATGPVSHNY